MNQIEIWIISLLSFVCAIVRPFKINEAFWALGGALLMLLLGLVSMQESLAAINKGVDVYLFLAGMMLLAETAREEKLFDWLASNATKFARGSSANLFILIYIVAIFITAFLSNDATAVVLTPAVAAAARSAKIEKPLPFLLICAFVANAASFLLPISNPANLIIYQNHLPSLFQWLPLYILPSFFSIAVTFCLLRFTQRKSLQQKVPKQIFVPALSRGAFTALIGIIGTSVVLLTCSSLNVQLGLPTAATGIITASIVLITVKKKPFRILRGISWPIFFFVAALFVIVEALNKTGLAQMLASASYQSLSNSVNQTAWAAGLAAAFGSNLINNLPAGLIAANVLQAGHLPELINRAIVIGIDLGPNFSVPGSLATILWMAALRREGISITGWQFLKLGSIIMLTALLCALASLWI